MSPFTVGLIASLIALVFMYIDTRLFDNPKSRTTYVKNMLLTGSITGFLFYLIGNGGFKVDFDIEASGFTEVKYVRLTDLVADGDPFPTLGFDLDAVEALHSVVDP